LRGSPRWRGSAVECPAASDSDACKPDQESTFLTAGKSDGISRTEGRRGSWESRRCLPPSSIWRPPPGDRELPARPISAATPCPARHREAGRSHRAASATATDLGGVGLRGLYLHVDRGNRGTPSGRRREVLAPRRVARRAGGFVPDA